MHAVLLTIAIIGVTLVHNRPIREYTLRMIRLPYVKFHSRWSLVCLTGSSLPCQVQRLTVSSYASTCALGLVEGFEPRIFLNSVHR